MNIESYRQYCLQKAVVTEEFPFDEQALVFKVACKMFAITNVDTFESISLKCNPERAVALREEYPDIIIPGYHSNKKHWNTVIMNAGLPDAFVKELIDHSYQMVVAGMPKKLQKEIAAAQ